MTTTTTSQAGSDPLPGTWSNASSNMNQRGAPVWKKSSRTTSWPRASYLPGCQCLASLWLPCSTPWWTTTLYFFLRWHLRWHQKHRTDTSSSDGCLSLSCRAAYTHLSESHKPSYPLLRWRAVCPIQFDELKQPWFQNIVTRINISVENSLFLSLSKVTLSQTCNLSKFVHDWIFGPNA